MTAPAVQWQDRAACRGEDTERWFPLNAEGADEVRGICTGCPVRMQCAQLANSVRTTDGVFAGFYLPSERRELARFATGEPVRPLRKCETCGKEFDTVNKLRQCAECRLLASGDRVSARPVQAHIDALREIFDVGYGQIGQAAGLTKSAVATVASPRTKTVRRETADAILSVTTITAKQTKFTAAGVA
ncbi:MULTISPECIES: WhiB family transcriptional regulator [Nocardia]|uniref:WhiB family transcriptional regulator n=1 Tax=Nocardia TaxID=1817 RepID=UPI002458F212|nr:MULTISPECIES: WhiB family transcriptional regulator [Nocardia]